MDKRTQLYFLSDQYYTDFPNCGLVDGGKIRHGQEFRRPCFLAFLDHKRPEIFWVVPISSRVEKYHKIEAHKLRTYGRCNTIRFGTVLGREAAFLIQNMFPVTEKYLIQYKDKNQQPIHIDGRIVTDVRRHASEVLALYRRGAPVLFTNVQRIYRGLEIQLDAEQANPRRRSIVDRLAAAEQETERRNAALEQKRRTPARDASKER